MLTWKLDSREREKNSRTKKTAGRLPPPPPVFPVYNLTRFTLAAALYYLNAWNRLESYEQVGNIRHKYRSQYMLGVLGLIFDGFVPLAYQSPYPIIVYFVASYRPHLSHFWANM